MTLKLTLEYFMIIKSEKFYSEQFVNISKRAILATPSQ